MKKLIPSIILMIFFSFTFSSNPPGWFIQYTPTNGRLINDISFLDSLNGWAVTDFGNGQDTCFILKTTNGGIDWLVEYPSLSFIFYEIKLFNNYIGYVIGAHTGNGWSLVLKTSDGGQNWFETNFPPGNPPLTDMSFINPDTGWVCADIVGFGGIWRTTSGGATWQQQVGGQTVNNVFFTDGNTGWYSRSNSLYKTTNEGNNWNMQQNFSSFIDDMFFINSDTGWITGGIINNSGIIKTINSGNNWFAQNDPGATIGGKLFFLGNERGWLGGASGKIFVCLNNGTLWGVQRTINMFFISNKTYFTDTLNGWGGTPAIIHTTDGGGPITSIKNNTSSIPDKFELKQNYPNPFNPGTIINYELRIANYISLRVYDINGKLIKELVNGRQNAGSYKIEFNGSSLPSGVYYYMLETEFGGVTKKMLLVK